MVLAAAVVVAVGMMDSPASASTGRAFTSAGGVAYKGGSNRASFNFSDNPEGGTLDGGGSAKDRYHAEIVCATFPGGGVAYFGAHITLGAPDVLKAGQYVFWRVTAGGPGVGTVAGLSYKTRTCYKGSNGGLVGPSYRINSGKITVTKPGRKVTVSSVSPNHGSPAGGTAITIKGLGFGKPGSKGQVSLCPGDPSGGCVAATNVVVHSNSHITAVTPPASFKIVDGGGAANVRVSVKVGGHLLDSDNSAAFLYTLRVDSVSPNHGSPAGGTAITIKGLGFGKPGTKDEVTLCPHNALPTVQRLHPCEKDRRPLRHHDHGRHAACERQDRRRRWGGERPRQRADRWSRGRRFRELERLPLPLRHAAAVSRTRRPSGSNRAESTRTSGSHFVSI